MIYSWFGQNEQKMTEQSFVNAIINIRILEMDSMIHWKPHSNVRDSGWETAQKWLKGPRKLIDIVKIRDGGVRDTERIYKGKLMTMLKEPNKKFAIVKVRDSGYLR